MASNEFKGDVASDIERIDAHKLASKPVVGTIRLFDEGGIVLIPTPTNDPNGLSSPKFRFDQTLIECKQIR
jgi:hypothetical protein